MYDNWSGIAVEQQIHTFRSWFQYLEISEPN